MAVANGEIIDDADYVASSAGAGSAGKVVKLNASGKVDATMLDAPKSYVDGLDGANVKKTGDQTVAGVKTFGSIPVLPASDPTTDNQAARKKYVNDQDSAEASARSNADFALDTLIDGLDAANVKLTGNQAVAGVKTFSSFPVTPSSAPTTNYQTANKKYVDDLDAANVKLSGNQTINGIKTFGSIPVGPASDPTTDNQLTRKAYVDKATQLAAGTVLLASADTEQSHNGTSYTLKKEIMIGIAGVITVKFSIKGSSSHAYGRIYVNGAAVGTERNGTNNAYVEYSENITVAAGDLIQIYTKTDNSSYNVYCKNFRLYVAGYQGAVINTD